MARGREPDDTPPRAELARVQEFWEANPLCALESPHPVGTREFFAWHDAVCAADVEPFAMRLYEFDRHAGERVLDVGCGIGWLCRHFAAGRARITGIGLTRRGVELTRNRLGLEGLQCALVQASAERLPFSSACFDFVVCAGVLHHTPGTLQGIREIHRVLRPGGRAMISLYYRNWLLSPYVWPLTRLLIRSVFGQVPGRTTFRRVQAVDDLVRSYDGDENPLGKSYSRHEVSKLLSDFIIERQEVHYFPRRFLPLGRRVPRGLHRLLDRHCGLMIYASLRKDG